MGTEILNSIFFYFKAYGYYILFFVLLLENTIFLGLIVPGETILLLASFLLLTVISISFTWWL